MTDLVKTGGKIFYEGIEIGINQSPKSEYYEAIKKRPINMRDMVMFDFAYRILIHDSERGINIFIKDFPVREDPFCKIGLITINNEPVNKFFVDKLSHYQFTVRFEIEDNNSIKWKQLFTDY